MNAAHVMATVQLRRPSPEVVAHLDHLHRLAVQQFGPPVEIAPGMCSAAAVAEVKRILDATPVPTSGRIYQP